MTFYELVKQLREVLKDFWQEELNQKKTKRKVESLEAALTSLSPDITEIRIKTPLTEKDAQIMKKINDQTLQVVANILDSVQQKMDKDWNKQNNLRNHNNSNDDIVEEFTEMADYPIQVDERIVTALKRQLRPLLFERSLKRRTASVVGTSFVPSHFHQIKTNPGAAKIRKSNLRIQRVLDEVAIALVFDRSRSMASGKKETVAQQTAAIFYKALCSTSKAQIYLFGFNDVPVLIKGRHYLPLTTVLRRIPLALKAKSGTDFPLALKVTINLIEKIAVHKKIIFILTDGDISGFDDPVELVKEAYRKNIDVFVIAVEGSDYLELANQFGKTNVIKINFISELPFKIKKMVVESLKIQNV